MEIQSALSSGLQGFQNATEDAKKAAADIASQTASNRKAGETYQVQANKETESKEPVATANFQAPDLTESVVKLKVAEVQAKASAAVIQTADETLGTLIDVRV
ncbi:MAG: hypothetical protein HRT38_03020 [Alteromonadaceae bacterium]|nr:hypothetical protein [Alteromonadaceae bacterium]